MSKQKTIKTMTKALAKKTQVLDRVAGPALVAVELVGGVRDVVAGYNERALLRERGELALLLGAETREDARALSDQLARDMEYMSDEVRVMYWQEIINTLRRGRGPKEIS